MNIRIVGGIAAVLLLGGGRVTAQLARTPPAVRHARVLDDSRLFSDRTSPVELGLPTEARAFSFAVFGDRTGGPPEGVEILADAVRDVNLVAPDLVMTVGDLIQGYNTREPWLAQMVEFKQIMDGLVCPWFPVAGNHDVYWRGEDMPAGQHEADYEQHFGPLWYAFRHKDCWFVSLYTDEGNPDTGEKAFNSPAAQTMSPAQFAWLDGILQRSREAAHVFVFLHHPRWIGGGYGDDWERVHRRLVEAGNVRAVFAGHIHRMRYDARDGIEYITLATVGGGQSGLVPAAGYRHHYDLVTVRPDGIAVASYPVGVVEDPRRITAEVSADCWTLANGRVVTAMSSLTVSPELEVDGEIELILRNPVGRPIELALSFTEAWPDWTVMPSHLHLPLAAHEESSLRFAVRRVVRGQGAEGFDPPELIVAMDYLAPGLRVPVPERHRPLSLRPLLEAPGPAAHEVVLHVDGSTAGGGSALRVEHADLVLPDGPLTVEGWLCADAFHERQGFVNKTESSGFGFFVNRGLPSFYLHLDGRYVELQGSSTLLEVGRWHHLAGVFDGSEARLYVDGNLVSSAPASGVRTVRDLPLLVGADVDGAGAAVSLFPGRIDEVRVSTTARYTGPRHVPARRFEPDEHTALLLHMERVGAWAYDSSGNGAHARVLGRAVLAREDYGRNAGG